MLKTRIEMRDCARDGGGPETVVNRQLAGLLHLESCGWRCWFEARLSGSARRIIIIITVLYTKAVVVTVDIIYIYIPGPKFSGRTRGSALTPRHP